MIARLGLLLPRRLGLACLVLAGVSAIELIWSQLDPVPSVLATRSSGPYSGDVPTPAVFEFPALAAFDEISARPLFAPDRKPVTEIDSAATSPSAISAPSLVITGIAGTGDQRYFVVRRDASPRLAPLRVGDEIEGWRVAAIAPDDVTLTNGLATAHYRLGESSPRVTSDLGNGPGTRTTLSAPSAFSDDDFSSFGRRYPSVPHRSGLPSGFHGFGWGIP